MGFCTHSFFLFGVQTCRSTGEQTSLGTNFSTLVQIGSLVHFVFWQTSLSTGSHTSRATFSHCSLDKMHFMYKWSKEGMITMPKKAIKIPKKGIRVKITSKLVIPKLKIFFLELKLFHIKTKNLQFFGFYLLWP